MPLQTIPGASATKYSHFPSSALPVFFLSMTHSVRKASPLCQQLLKLSEHDHSCGDYFYYHDRNVVIIFISTDFRGKI